MKTKTIHHLDINCNVTFTEVQHFIIGQLIKIEIIDFDQSKTVFADFPKRFFNKKQRKSSNQLFREKVKNQVKEKRIDSQKRADLAINKILRQKAINPIVTDSFLDIIEQAAHVITECIEFEHTKSQQEYVSKTSQQKVLYDALVSAFQKDELNK